MTTDARRLGNHGPNTSWIPFSNVYILITHGPNYRLDKVDTMYLKAQISMNSSVSWTIISLYTWTTYNKIAVDIFTYDSDYQKFVHNHYAHITYNIFHSFCN